MIKSSEIGLMASAYFGLKNKFKSALNRLLGTRLGFVLGLFAIFLLSFGGNSVRSFIYNRLKQNWGEEAFLRYLFFVRAFLSTSNILVEVFRLACKRGDDRMILFLLKRLRKSLSPWRLFQEQRYLLKLQKVYGRAGRGSLQYLALSSDQPAISMVAFIYLSKLDKNYRIADLPDTLPTSKTRSFLLTIEQFVESNSSEMSLDRVVDDFYQHFEFELSPGQKIHPTVFNTKDEMFLFTTKANFAKLLGERLVVLLGVVGKQNERDKFIAIFKLFYIYDIEKESFLIGQYLFSQFEGVISPDLQKQFHLLQESVASRFCESLNPVFFQKYDRLKERKKLVFLTAIWRRPALTKFVLSYYADLFERNSTLFEFEMIVVGSEGEQSSLLAEQHGFSYVNYRNKPLSMKWQAGLNLARESSPDAIVIVGSDDLISGSLIEDYHRKLSEGYLVYGLREFAVVSKERSLVWEGYSLFDSLARYLEPIGAGKVLTRPILEMLDYKLWDTDKRNKGLDRLITEKLDSCGLFPTIPGFSINLQGQYSHYKYGQVVWSFNDNRTYLTDIKVGTENVTPMKNFLIGASNYKELFDGSEFVCRYYGVEAMKGVQEVLGES